MKKVLILIVLVALGAVGFTMHQHATKIGRQPWQWSGDDWKAWASFAKEEAVTTAGTVKEKTVAATSTTWKYVTTKSQDLYDKSSDLLAKLGAKEETTAAPATTGGATSSLPAGTPAAVTGAETTVKQGLLNAGDALKGAADSAIAKAREAATANEPPADPLDSKSENYKYGKEWLKKGVQEWKVSLTQPGAAERAAKHFDKAISCFESAKSEVGDAAVADFLKLAKEYKADTDERIQMIKSSEAGS